MRRHEVRGKALQAMYQVEVGKADVDVALMHVLEETDNVTDADVRYLQSLVRGAAQHAEEIDNLLKSHVKGWTMDRIAKVDLAALRLAMYEMMFSPDIDIPTIVDEAVQLAKEFSTDESGKFVNGVLARLIPTAESHRQAH